MYGNYNYDRIKFSIIDYQQCLVNILRAAFLSIFFYQI